MLVVMSSQHTEAEVKTVVARIKEMGFAAHLIPGENSLAIGITGNPGALDPELFTNLPGVKEAIPVTKPYKLASQDFRPKKTEIRVGNTTFGPGHFVVIAGPCAVESEEQTIRIAEQVKKAGANVLRGGAYKPRTSPYAFQGMGLAGLKILRAASQKTGLPVITEAVDSESLQFVVEYADIIQLGARNMQNFSLLKEAGRSRKPVMLKRGPSATVEEWLLAAEYILSEGNDQLILCERGIRSFDDHARNMLDIGAVVALRLRSHLPVIVDPSHGTGKRQMVIPMARAAAAAGADGIMVDVHDRPQEALCDGPQAILPEEFAGLVDSLRKIRSAL